MAKVLVNESSLSGIAEAIRAKNGSSDTYKPSEMAAAIEAIEAGGGGGNEELLEQALEVTGDCQYRFAYNGWNKLLELFGDKITTKDITNINKMFISSSTLETVPFNINCSNNTTVSCGSMFHTCRKLKEVPKINNCKPSDTTAMFAQCSFLRELPDDFADGFDWSYMEGLTNANRGGLNNLFQSCYSLRKIPMSFLEHGNPVATYNYSLYYYGFQNCYALDEIINLPNPHYNVAWTSNAFYNTFYDCRRLKNLTFKMPNGAPYVVNWKSQTIDLTRTGYVYTVSQQVDITNYNSGITADKQVTDDATYQALKNDPDWFTCDVAYSRYNHDSAVATINSLPDTSAYLATAGGTNTIKFKGAAGSATDGGAINTLTETEIAVAAAKGWTVTLS